VRSGALIGALALPALLALLTLSEITVGATPARAFDEGLYARLLQRHTRVTPDTAGVRVAYANVRRDPEWAELLADLGSPDTRVPTAREESIAFWINAYNILVIETVARGYPIESIRDLGSAMWPVWRQREIAVAGEPRSLDEIEHEILRPMGDPRVHAALVCASVSCPSLLREPWIAERLDAQLESALSDWLSDPRKGFRIDRATGTVWLSKVFDWFDEDFGDGRVELLRFLSARLNAKDRTWLDARRGDVAVAFFDYDWRLNDLRTGRGTPPSAVSPGAAAR